MEKVILLSLVLVLFMVSALPAQYTIDSYFESDSSTDLSMEAGLIVSAGISNVVTSDEQTGSNTAGFSWSGGCFARMALSKKLALQPELIANINQWSYKYEQNLTTRSYPHKIVSIQMPVSLLISVNQNEDRDFFIGFGPFIGTPLIASVSYEDNSYSLSFLEDSSRVIYGAQVLGGVKDKKVSADIRASYEINDVYQNLGQGYNTNMWNIRLVLGYSFL